jgi:hypothetical protein
MGFGLDDLLDGNSVGFGADALGVGGWKTCVEDRMMLDEITSIDSFLSFGFLRISHGACVSRFCCQVCCYMSLDHVSINCDMSRSGSRRAWLFDD